MQPIRILCTGDLHLGRRPTSLPTIEDRYAVRYVWGRFVDYAIAQRVDAIALTGDLIDRENRFFEAFGPLQEGLQRLLGASIQVFAVAGNHDYDLLSSVGAFEQKGAHLLGRGGDWESAPLLKDGTTAAEIIGWSFPTQHVLESPMDSFEPPSTGLPVVGLLHAEIDQPDSRYAPVASQELGPAGVSAWLLGHIHRPHELESVRIPAVYPGSLQPLDPGEPGIHGASLVEIPTAGPATFSHVPLATLRYETIDVNLEEVSDQEGFRREVTTTLASHLEATKEVASSVEHAACRLRFTGRTAIHRDIDFFAEPLIDDLIVPFEGTEASVEGYVLDTRPVHDLEELAASGDPPGVLAQIILDLESEKLSPSHEKLLSNLSTDLGDITRSNKYGPLRHASDISSQPSTAHARQLLIRQGMLLLDAMMAQKG